MADQNLFIEAEKNSTFELEALEKTLSDIKQTSFDYLYEFQKNAVNYKRFDFRISDLKLSKNTSRGQINVTYPKKYIAHIKDNFISEKTRLAYKRSQYYGKELNVFQVANDPKIFTHVYMVFVDGKYYDTINIRCKEDSTEIIFDIQERNNPTGIPETHFNALKTKNARVTVFFLQNSAYGVYKTNINVLKMYQNSLALKDMNLTGSLGTDTQYITFVNNNDLLFSSVITDTYNSTEMLRFFNNNLQAFDSKYIHLNIFGFRNLLNQYNIPGTNKFFVIPLQDMPVPVENLMVFRNDVSGNKTFAHDITVKLYYPNVYEIVGNTTNANLTIYAFYFDDNTSQGLKFDNEVAVYQQLFGNDIGRYVSNVIPSVIKTFDPATLKYDIQDYSASAQANDHLKYKIEKLKTWISQNPNVLRKYLNNQIKTPSGYVIDVSKLNLTSKLRYNNHAEVDYEHEKLTFPDPRYLFILTNQSTDMYSDVRFYVDGILFAPDFTYKDDTYEYYYIPTSMVKSNSLIEIERLSEVEYQKILTFNSPLDKKAITPRSDWEFTPSDIYIVDPTINKFVDRNSFKVVITKNGVDIELPSSSLKNLSGTVNIRVTASNLLARQLYVFVRRHVYFEQKVIKEDDDVGTVFFFESRTNYDINNVRVFRNGRLISRSLYDVDFENRVGGKNFVTPKIRKKIGDKFVVDCTPYKYKVVLEQGGIQANGFLDLRGVINKPFDLKWYDIYLNGRRLNQTQVEIISPTLIFIKNVTTRKNLIIFEKDRDIEYFSIGNYKSLNDTLWDTDNEFRVTLNNRAAIADTETDVVTEIEDVIEFEKMRMFLLLIGTERMIDPDEFQISPEERERFPNMFNPTQDFYFIDPDENVGAITRMKIFPEYYKGYEE